MTKVFDIRLIYEISLYKLGNENKSKFIQNLCENFWSDENINRMNFISTFCLPCLVSSLYLEEFCVLGDSQALRLLGEKRDNVSADLWWRWSNRHEQVARIELLESRIDPLSRAHRVIECPMDVILEAQHVLGPNQAFGCSKLEASRTHTNLLSAHNVGGLNQ